jgi:hypothetical protein
MATNARRSLEETPGGNNRAAITTGGGLASGSLRQMGHGKPAQHRAPFGVVRRHTL